MRALLARRDLLCKSRLRLTGCRSFSPKRKRFGGPVSQASYRLRRFFHASHSKSPLYSFRCSAFSPQNPRILWGPLYLRALLARRDLLCKSRLRLTGCRSFSPKSPRTFWDPFAPAGAFFICTEGATSFACFCTQHHLNVSSTSFVRSTRNII